MLDQTERQRLFAAEENPETHTENKDGQAQGEEQKEVAWFFDAGGKNFVTGSKNDRSTTIIVSI